MHVTGLNKSRQSVVDSSARLAALQVELRGVIEWFSPGVQLKIPTDELMTIRKDHRYTYDCRLEMLIRWEQLEKPTWTKLVSALVNIGRRDIAKKIAKKHGVPLPATEEPQVQGPAIHVHKNVESSGCGNHPRTTDSVKSGECLSLLEEEVERATQTRDAVSKALEMDIDTTLPELQMKVSSLNQDVRLLKTELRNREEENQMLKEAQQSLKKWNETIQRTRRENSEAIKVLREEIKKKEEELARTKAQLADKEKELSEKMKELDVKSARVLELQNELENVRRDFINQQEEMDQTPLLELKLPLKLNWKWSSAMPFGVLRCRSAVVMNGDVYFGGGAATSDDNNQIVCVYTPGNDSWSQLPPYKYRYFRLAVINENQLVAVGGEVARTRKVTNKLAVWDDEQCQWVFSLPAMNTACRSPAVATYNQWLLIAGGYGEEGVLSRVEVMNVTVLSKQWYQVASLPVACHRMSSVIIGNTWYLMGGFADKENKSVMSICVEHVISEAIISQSAGANSSTKWNSLPDTPLELSTALAFQGALLAIGGGDYSKAIYLYQPSTSKWIKACDMPTG